MNDIDENELNDQEPELNSINEDDELAELVEAVEPFMPDGGNLPNEEDLPADLDGSLSESLSMVERAKRLFNSKEAEDQEEALREPEEPTQSVRARVTEALLDGRSADDLIAEGFNKSTVKTIASELRAKGAIAPVERKGSRKSRTDNGEETSLTVRGKDSAIRTYQKGSPPEAIINAVTLPDAIKRGVGGGEMFESGMKFGMSTIVLAVRITQELAAMGTMQIRPLVDMARDMRKGEIDAAKGLSKDAAGAAAEKIADAFGPFIQDTHERVQRMEETVGKSKGPPPPRDVKEMQARMMMPIQQNMMNMMMNMMRVLPGAGNLLGPAQPPQTPTSSPETQPVTGWDIEEQ